MNKSTHQALVIPLIIEDHPNSVKLGIVRNGGYTIVINKEDWVGRNKEVCHILPDSIVQLSRPEFKWLDKGDGKKEHIVKPVRLRGVISYGFLVPAPKGLNIGDDAADILGIKH